MREILFFYLSNMQCPKCCSDKHRKNGFINKKQRYTCKECGCQFTQSHKRGKPASTKALAYILYLEGLGFRSIARVLKVSNVAVLKWIRALAEVWGSKDQEEKKTPRHCEVIEIDEMWHYLQKKNRKSGSGLLLIELPEKCLPGKLVVVAANHSKNS